MPQKLKLALKPTFSAPVVLRVPGDNQIEEIRFNVVFKRLTKAENDVVEAALNDRTLTDKAMLDKVLADWNGLDSEDGTPFICTAENRASAVNDWPTFEAAIVRSYFDHAYPAAVKN